MFLLRNFNSIFLSGIIFIFLSFSARAADVNVDKVFKKELRESQYYLLIDPDTGDVLLSKNSDERVAPSSMTKMMTAYVVFDQIAKGLISPDKQCVVGKNAWRKTGSTMFLNYGDMVSINELLKGLLVVSGNDASIVLAESVAGTQEDFVYLMNIKARELGLKNSQFKNPHGLSEDGHYMTMRDLSTLIKRIYEDFPQYATYMGIEKFTYGNITQRNRHPLIRSDYDGSIGGKTGHTDAGGYGIASIVERGDRRLIAVMNKAETSSIRRKVITQLFDHGFDNYKKATIFRRGQIISDAKVWLGKDSKVGLVAKKNVAFNIPREISIDDIKTNVTYIGPISAPVKRGDKIAKLKVEVKGYKTFEYDLFANKSVEKSGYFRTISQILIHKTKNFYNKLLNKRG